MKKTFIQNRDKGAVEDDRCLRFMDYGLYPLDIDKLPKSGSTNESVGLESLIEENCKAHEKGNK